MFAVKTNDYTLECWVKPDDMSTDCGKLFSWNDGSNGDGFMAVKRDNIGWYEGSSIGAKININDGKFHHIAFVRHNQIRYIYVDGTLAVNSTASSTTKNLTNNKLYIGVNGAMSGYESEYFSGLVDEIAFFDYARYTTEFTPEETPYKAVIK
jgi:hypothetical protein